MVGDFFVVLTSCLFIVFVNGWTVFPLPNTPYQPHATPALQSTWQKPSWYQNWNQPSAQPCVEGSTASPIIAPGSIPSPALPLIVPKKPSRSQVSVMSTDEYLTPTAVLTSPQYMSTSEPY
uniref:Uncharacterized protein n=1 Tax=Papilio xuthus TaxID=66420 RepID=I4DLQ7_PAPXU|nr:unknown secreted protein [Papilio xuthus]